jgi:uncharacterized protein YkwD
MKHVLLIALLLLLFLVACEPSKANQDATATASEIETEIGWLEATLNAEAITQAPSSTPTPPAILPERKSPSPTMTAFQGASVEVLINANCRSGPGTIYPVITAYFAGETVQIVGISPDGMWRVVQIAAGDSRCWMWGELIAILGMEANLPTFPMPPTPEIPAAGPGDTAFELTLLELINNERAKVGAGPLRIDARLVAAARSHSTDMALNDFFDHVNLKGMTFNERIAAQGYVFSAAGETLSAGGDPATCITMWLESPSHRETMLNPIFTEVGIGVFWYTESNWTVYVTADYGRP